jgi:DNA-directed RNA polymerase specialized sigma24 family protein
VDEVDKDADVHAVVFTGAHPDRFLSHADVTWLQRDAIETPGAWLTTVASRICLNVLRSARARRETYVGVIPGAPHSLTATHQDQVNADLLSFLES